MNIFWGCDEIVDIFWGHHKTGLFLVVISIHYRAFSSGQGTELEYILGCCKISNIFGGMPDIPDIIFFLEGGGGGGG